MADNFNPDDYLDDFDPEAYASDAEPKKEEVSKSESFGRGITQGGTLGFSDEAGGAFQTVLNKLGLSKYNPVEISQMLQKQGFKGDIGPTSDEELYRQARDEEREKNLRAQETNPATYLTGELGSAFIPGLGTLGAMSKAAKGASTASKIARGAATGATVGGLAGLGSTEADLTQGQFKDASEDISTGAALGGILGASFPAIGKATSKLKEKISKTGKKLAEESQFAGDLARSYELGQEGTSILGKSGQKVAEQKVIQAGKELQDAIFNKLDENFKQKLDLFKNRPNETINFSKLYQDTMSLVDDSVRNAEIVDPVEANNLRTALQRRFYEKLPEKIKGGIKYKTTEAIDPNTGEIVSTTLEKTLKREAEEGIPEAKQVVSKMKEKYGSEGDLLKQVKTEQEAFDVAKDGVMRGAMSLEDAANFVRDFQRTASKVKMTEPVRSGIFKGAAGKASDIIEEAVPETAPLNLSSTKGYEALEELGIKPFEKGEVTESSAKFVKGLDKALEPTARIKETKVFDALKGTLGEEKAKELEKATRRASGDFWLGKRATEGEQISSMSQIVGSFKDRIVKGANVAGMTKQYTNDIASSMQRVFLNLEKSAMEPLALAIETRGTATSKKIADQLREAATSNESKRNAILFSIMQNPGSRDELKNVFGFEDKEE